jgi:hypothetical protein
MRHLRHASRKRWSVAASASSCGRKFARTSRRRSAATLPAIVVQHLRSAGRLVQHRNKPLAIIVWVRASD